MHLAAGAFGLTQEDGWRRGKKQMDEIVGNADSKPVRSKVQDARRKQVGKNTRYSKDVVEFGSCASTLT